MTVPAELVDAWSDLVVHEAIAAGHRSEVWRVDVGGERAVLRRSRRSVPSLDWELELLTELDRRGVVVPRPIATVDGLLRRERWSVHRWVDGRPPSSEADWASVAGELVRLHDTLRSYPQRPGCCAVFELRVGRRSVDADLDRTPSDVVERCLPHLEVLSARPSTVIHGDPGPENLRVLDDGRVGFLDWDEARVDVADLDLANLGVPVLTGARRQQAEAAAHAWEALNGWVAEPEYAASRLAHLPSPRS